MLPDARDVPWPRASRCSPNQLRDRRNRHLVRGHPDEGVDWAIRVCHVQLVQAPRCVEDANVQSVARFRLLRYRRGGFVDAACAVAAPQERRPGRAMTSPSSPSAANRHDIKGRSARQYSPGRAPDRLREPVGRSQDGVRQCACMTSEQGGSRRLVESLGDTRQRVRRFRFTISGVSFRLETPRLVIRTLDYGDADAWLAMFSAPEIHRFLPPGPAFTMETFERALASRHAMEREIGYAMWAVDDRPTGTFIGQCGIRPAKSMDENAGSEIDLAYHFATASWSKGYATRGGDRRDYARSRPARS